MREQKTEIQADADRQKEQAQQQALERLDRHFRLVAELGLGQ